MDIVQVYLLHQTVNSKKFLAMYPHLISTHILMIIISDAALQPIAYFNDSRCGTSGVCATDSLFFTCELYEVFFLRVVLPSGDQEHISVGDNTADVALPVGFTAVSLLILPIDVSSRNISLTLSIMNASLLDGGMIKCEDAIKANNNIMVMAGCPLDSKLIINGSK